MALELDGLILDMDGVLWRGNDPLPGLNLFFETLNSIQLPFVLATNNSTLSVELYVEKLAGMGVEVQAEQILTSAYATADYLRTIAPAGTRVYAVGEMGLKTALETQGFQLSDDAAEYVIVGLDRQFTYDKMSAALRLINQGAQFIGTNPDLTLPTPSYARPGAGAILASLSAASGIQPTIVGKPEPLMLQQALARLNTRPEHTAMVGDRLETDILGGINAGLRTVLVLSGVTNAEMLAESSIRPDWVSDDIQALAANLENSR